MAGKCIGGNYGYPRFLTLDSPTKVDPNPVPGDEDINWILKEVGNYLSPGNFRV